MHKIQCKCWFLKSKDKSYTAIIIIDFNFPGCIPLDPNLSKSEEDGVSFIETFEKSSAREAVLNVVSQVIKRTNPEDDSG